MAEPWLVGVVLFLSACLCTLALRKAWDRKRRKRIMRRAQRGEALARRILRRSGYVVLGEQVRQNTTYFVDDKPVSAVVIADFIVKRRGRRYVAEVKTGKRRSARSPNIRRQLLEYQRAFNVDALVLVDAEERTVSTVAFDRKRFSWLGR